MASVVSTLFVIVLHDIADAYDDWDCELSPILSKMIWFDVNRDSLELSISTDAFFKEFTVYWNSTSTGVSMIWDECDDGMIFSDGVVSLKWINMGEIKELQKIVS